MGQALFGRDNITCSDLDVIDYQIINLLQEDCRLSYSKVAAKVGVSVGTAFNRIKIMEAKGLLKGYSLVIDSTKLGYSLTAVIFVQAAGGNLSIMESEVAKADCVVAVYDVTGEFDAVVIAKFKGRSELSAFIKELAAETFVKRTVTAVSLSTVKEEPRFKFGEGKV
ncbi:MAG TPA: Lrp/AsnC family transcriptional regulator [Candidatus Nanoarchaeia archaeon]|nr:Lrp/AsnC family transcriptional regulator [Candidatus Nanoarchaeia archaeon]